MLFLWKISQNQTCLYGYARITNGFTWICTAFAYLIIGCDNWLCDLISENWYLMLQLAMHPVVLLIYTHLRSYSIAIVLIMLLGNIILYSYCYSIDNVIRQYYTV